MPFKGLPKYDQILYVWLTAWQVKQCTQWISVFQTYPKHPGKKGGPVLSPIENERSPNYLLFLSHHNNSSHLLCIYCMSHTIKALFYILTYLKSMIIIGILQTKKRRIDRLIICQNSPLAEPGFKPRQSGCGPQLPWKASKKSSKEMCA